VALICEADARAARLTLTSVSCQTAVPARTVLLLGESPSLRRSGGAMLGDVPDLVERIDVRAGFSMRNAALRAAAAGLGEADIVVLVREGLVLEAELLDELAGRFSREPALLAGLVSYGRGGLNINELSEEQLASGDPWKIVAGTSGFERAAVVLKARYLRPCMLVVRVSRARDLKFEEFSSLGDWYAYRLLLGGLDREDAVFQETSPRLGYVGNQPDRRDPYAQGREAARALYGIAAGYPAFAEDVRADFRTLMRSQLSNVLDPAHARTARNFLRGMLAQRWAQRSLRRRLDRDIAELS
jgi:hypothetical protein